MSDEYQFLLPQPDNETQEYWDAANNKELRIPRCTDCQTYRWPPQKTCPVCYGENVEWVQVSGRGTLYTYVIVHQAVLSQWREVAPYNVVQVSIEEAPNVIITGNAIDIDNSELKVGLPMEVVFDQVTPEDTLPRWRLRRS